MKFTAMPRIFLVLAVVIMSFLAGCGGGGFGAAPIVTGRIIWLASGTGPVPVPAVQAGSSSSNAASDGSFSLTVNKNTTTFLVVYQPTTGAPITFTFTTPPVVANLDVGDWVIAPQKVTVTGKVRSASTNDPVVLAEVTMAGARAISDASGDFSLNNVAYDPAAVVNFLSLEGRAAKAGFFPKIFSPANVPVAGFASTEDVLLTEDTGTAPPGTPFNVEGLVSPAGSASGTIVELFDGATLIRSFTVGIDRKFGFWILPGSYTLKARKPGSGLTAADQSVVLNSQTQTLRKDVTLN